MRYAMLTLLLLAPLVAACGKAEEPLIPELQGRWAPPTTSKAMEQPRVQQVSNPPKQDPNFCRILHVTFSKERIALNLLGIGVTVFHISGMKREGQRLILSGTPDGDKNPAAQGKLVVLLRDGEVRFDDVYDERGRSLRYERLPEGHAMRKHGATTVGDAFKQLLDVKPCPTA